LRDCFVFTTPAENATIPIRSNFISDSIDLIDFPMILTPFVVFAAGSVVSLWL
jgi:hypothetical protein